MFANALVVAAALYGVDYGWQPIDEGGLEYIIQVEPQLLEAMRGGEAITSTIPPELRDVRRYRIVVGNAELPRSDLPPIEEETEAAQTPRRFEQDGESALIEQAAGTEAMEPSADGEEALTANEAETLTPAAVEAPKPWMPFTLALICLFASIGGNGYFLWLIYDARRRYRMLVQDMSAGS